MQYGLETEDNRTYHLCILNTILGENSGADEAAIL